MSTTNKVHIYGPDFSTFVRSVMLICEELGVTYTTGFSANGKAIEFKSDEHFKLHPYGKLRALEIIEVEINRGELLGTDKFTIADALVMPMLQYLTTLPAEVNCLEGFNAIKNYVERSMQRASCKKVLKSDNKPIA